MSAGRTSWWPKDAAWHRRERIVELGEEHGPGGPNVMDVLSAWAQEQRAGGGVRGGFRTLAREAFVPIDVARAIVRHAGENGALDDLLIEPDGRRFTCRVSGWKADQDRGRAAIRKAAERDGKTVTNAPDVTLSHAESRSVTPSALHNQTIEEQPPLAPPQAGGNGLPATPPGVHWDTTRAEWVGGRDRVRQRFTEAIEAYAAEVFSGADRAAATKAVTQALRSGCSDDAAVRAHVKRWFGHLLKPEGATA